MSVSARSMVWLLGVAGFAAFVVGYLPHDGPLATAAGLLLSSVAVGVVPGALIFLAWRPVREVTLFELLSAALAISFGLIEILTIFALLAHRPLLQVFALLALVAAAHAVVAARAGVIVRIPRTEIAVSLAVGVLAACLYLVGSPFSSTEDQIHIAIARRLVDLERPALDNIYFVPNVVYTYPFPGTHYFMSLVSRLADIDTLFVYHKLRAFWGAAALVLLYGCARRFFQSERLATASALVAAALTAGGAFAAVPGFYWGQMAPFSHASDVAMGVLLPALLFGGLWTVQAARGRELWVAAATTFGVLLMLAIVHVREVVQFAVYLAAFALALLATRRDPAALRRSLGLLVVTICVTAGFNQWHEHVAPALSNLVERNRADLLDVMHRISLTNVMTPAITIVRSNFIAAFEAFFFGWNPLVLLAGGIVLYALRARTAALMMPASILSYALIVRVAPLAIAYIYATYFEILFTPVRNMIFFVHILAGVVVYVVAATIARQRAWIAAPLTCVVAGGVALSYSRVGAAMLEHSDLLFIPLVAIYAGTALAIIRNRAVSTTDAILDARPSFGALVVMATMVVSMVWASWDSSASPIAAASRGETFATATELLVNLPCSERETLDLEDTPEDVEPLVIVKVRSCPPPETLMRFARQSLPVTAVIAVDRFEGFSPAMFMPQQVDVWPGQRDGLIDERLLFAPYYRYYDTSVRRYRDQPFFNTVETPAERRAFLAGLGVTHVLLNPRTYDRLKPVLDADPTTYRSLYDDGQWAIYEVAR